MRLQDLVFREDADGLPAGAPRNYCGARGATLSAEVPLPGGHTALIALCSCGCESALKREKDGDKWLASFLAEAERMCAGADEQWPEEIDVSS